MTELTRDDLLIVLMEECAEIIKAASKCLRFGYDRDYPGYGQNNLVLAEEIGDLLGWSMPSQWTDGHRRSGWLIVG